MVVQDQQTDDHLILKGQELDEGLTDMNIQRHDLETLALTQIRKQLIVFLVCGLWIALSLITPAKMFGAEEKFHRPTGSTESNHHANSRWNYKGFQGPRFWGFLEQAYKECRMGHEQSPIDVVMPHHPNHQEKLDFHYAPTQFEAVTSSHGVQFFASGRKNRMLFNNRIYYLNQFHFHAPSEHHIQGKEFPLEMHLVHEDESGHLLVLAVLLTLGKDNPILAKIEGSLDGSNWVIPVPGFRNRHEALTLNPVDLLPSDLHHFSYHGSLTTPPCTQGVQWILLRTSIHLSQLQLTWFSSNSEPNARPVQPLYGREIEMY